MPNTFEAERYFVVNEDSSKWWLNCYRFDLRPQTSPSAAWREFLRVWGGDKKSWQSNGRKYRARKFVMSIREVDDG